LARLRGPGHREFVNASIVPKKLSDLIEVGLRSVGRRSRKSPLKSSIAPNQPNPSIGLKGTKEPPVISKKNGDIRAYDLNARGVGLDQRQAKSFGNSALAFPEGA
jgi:hypothetical protein